MGHMVTEIQQIAYLAKAIVCFVQVVKIVEDVKLTFTI
jgi:hypothetical protein